MTDILVYLQEIIARTEDNVAESCRLGPHSYGAGYDSGYLDALQLVRAMIKNHADGKPMEDAP
jgi:hypothetical protein